MSLIGYISSRFNRHRTLPPSLRTMRVIAICGIAIATATLVITLSILKGFEQEYRRTILGFNAHVVLLKAGEADDSREVTRLIEAGELTDDDREFISSHWISWRVWQLFGDLFRIAHLGSLWDSTVIQRLVKDWHIRVKEIERKGIIGVTPFIYREGLMIAHGAIKGVVIKGVDTATLRDVNPMEIDLVSGHASLEDALEAEFARPVILGRGLAKALNLDVTDSPANVKLLVPTRELQKDAENFDTLTAVGTFESGLYDYDAQFALMTLSSVRELFDMPKNRITGIELKLDDPDKAVVVSNWLEDHLSPSWRAIPWSELNADIFRAVEMEKRTFSIIMGMLMVVAAFNIIGVLVLIILVRSHEISVLRSLGMMRSQLRKVFTRGGLVIGFFGVLCGLVLGVGASFALSKFEIVRIAPEVYFLSRLPIDISLPVCGMISVFCLFACWLTSAIAANKLSDVPIAEGLSGTY